MKAMMTTILMKMTKKMMMTIMMKWWWRWQGEEPTVCAACTKAGAAPLSSPRNFSVFNEDRDEDHNFLIIIIIIISSLIDHIIIILSPSLAISLFSTRIGMRIIIIIIWIVMVLTIIFISLVRLPKFIFQNGFGVLSVQYTVHTVSQRTQRQEI